MPKFNFEEVYPQCTRCGCSEYMIEDHLAYCADCGTQIIFEDHVKHVRKGKKVKKARFRE